MLVLSLCFLSGALLVNWFPQCRSATVKCFVMLSNKAGRMPLVEKKLAGNKFENFEK